MGRIGRKFLGRSPTKKKDLLYLAQIEFGESGEHIHLHGVIAGLPPKAVSCESLMDIWENQIHEGGKSLITPYDTKREGVEYVLKIWRDPQQISLIQANECWPMYSKSTVDTLRRGITKRFQCE